MASLNGIFDANTVEPSAPREVIPAGKYVAQIINSEMRDTKNGAGQYLWLEMDILDGEFAGRHIFDRLNLMNANATAQDIAQRALSAICRAVGVMQVSDSEQLHHKPMLVTVKVRPAGPDKTGVQREASNEVGAYEAVNGAAPATRTAAAKPAAAAPAKANAAPPWKRSAA